MTTRTEDVVGGLAKSIEAIDPTGGELLIVRLGQAPAPDSTRTLSEWLQKNLCEKRDVLALIVPPGEDVRAMTMEELGFTLWGSDCDKCGNTTPESQRCDSCGSTKHTRKLWIEAKA